MKLTKPKIDSVVNDYTFRFQSINKDIEENSDGYEEITASHRPDEEKKQVRPSALQLVGPKGPSRTLWCEIPEVINSQILCKLSPRCCWRSVSHFIFHLLLLSTSNVDANRKTATGSQIRDSNVGGVLSEIADATADTLYEPSGLPRYKDIEQRRSQDFILVYHIGARMFGPTAM